MAKRGLIWLTMALAITAAVLIPAQAAGDQAGPSESASGQQAESPSVWPPMTVVFLYGESGLPGIKTTLEYLDEYHWRSVGGGYLSFFNGEFVVTRDSSDTYLVQRHDGSGALLPLRWFRPDWFSMIAGYGFGHDPALSGDGIEGYSLDYEWACPTDDLVELGLDVPAACDAGEAFFMTRESYRFRTDIEPPLVIEAFSEIDGEKVGHYQVLEVDFTRPNPNLTIPAGANVLIIGE
jgi:hypothetical protein